MVSSMLLVFNIVLMFNCRNGMTIHHPNHTFFLGIRRRDDVVQSHLFSPTFVGQNGNEVAFPYAPCMLHLPTKLGDFQGKCWCAYSSTMGCIWDLYPLQNVAFRDLASNVEKRAAAGTCL